MVLVMGIGQCAGFLGCHKHLLSFCLVPTAVSALGDFNYLNKANTREENLLSLSRPQFITQSLPLRCISDKEFLGDFLAPACFIP